MTTPASSGPEQQRTASPQDAGEAVQPQAAEPAAEPRPQPAVARVLAADPGPGWAAHVAPAADRRAVSPEATTVLPADARRAAAPPRPVPPRPVGARPEARPGAGASRPLAGRTRRARLSLRRIDPWSVFLFTLVASVFLGVALVVAVAVLYAVLGTLGVTESLNELYAEVTGGSVETDALLTAGRIIGGSVVLALVNVVFLTLLATLGAMLYNLVASFTGGIELTFGERD